MYKDVECSTAVWKKAVRRFFEIHTFLFHRQNNSKRFGMTSFPLHNKIFVSVVHWEKGQSSSKSCDLATPSEVIQPHESPH